MSHSRLRASYEAALVVAGAATIAYCVHRGELQSISLANAAVFALALTAAFLLPVPHGVSTAAVHCVDFPLTLAVLLLYGPTPAGVVSALVCWVAPVRMGRARWSLQFLWILVLNVSVTILATQCAGRVYYLLGGAHFVEAEHRNASVVPGIVAGCVLVVSQALLANTGYALRAGRPWNTGLARTLRFTVPSSMFLTPFSLVIAWLYNHLGPLLALAPFFLPFLAARHWMVTQVKMVNVYLETVALLGHAMHRFHQYTCDHEAAVAKWAERIAQRMSLPPETVTFIRYAGLLHDIGKIAWGETLLDKTGTLSTEELGQIRRHASDSAEYVSKMRYFSRIVPWIRHHHERWDGKGYPDGLAGDNIPLEAAILTVADCFHAMQDTKRPYKKPLSPDEALAEVQRCSGRQFNPRVVEALTQLVEKNA